MHLFWSWSIYCTYLPYLYTVWEFLVFFLNVKGITINGTCIQNSIPETIVGIKWELFTWPLVQFCWVSRCFNLIFNISPSTSVFVSFVRLKIFQTPLNNYQPESSQILNITISAFRQPVFVYRSGKCMDWDYDWLNWDYTVHYLYIGKQFLYNSYKVFCTINASIMNSKTM